MTRSKTTVLPAQASVDVATVRHRFNFEWATSNPIDGLDTYWWWARSIRVDPNEVIADDDEGNLWSIPFSTDGEDEITFGEPVRVRETYVPITAGDGVAATAAVSRRRQRTLASALERPAKPSPPSASSTGPQGQEAHTMDLTALREHLGVGDDVSDDEVIRLAAERLSTQLDDEPAVPDVEETPVAQVPPVPPPSEEPAAEAEPAEEPSVEQLEVAALAATVERLAAEAEARARREAAETRERVLSAAVASGRITPAERTQVWEPFYDASPEQATARLEALPANRVPVAELGYGPDSGDAAKPTAYPAHLLSARERARVEAARKGA